MTFDVTDAWHPTVNPSARMPVHHHRHLAVLGHGDGLLNEFPRHRGGTTIRLPRVRDGRLHVMELGGDSVFAPWWLPAPEPDAVRHITQVYGRPCDIRSRRKRSAGYSPSYETTSQHGARKAATASRSARRCGRPPTPSTADSPRPCLA